MNFEIPFFVFQVDSARFLLKPDDPGDYLYPICGRITEMDDDEGDILAGAGVVAIKPFPLQFEQSIPAEDKIGWHAEMQLSSFRETEHDSIRKLQNHYSKLGFVEMKSTPHMILSTARRLPSIEKLLTC